VNPADAYAPVAATRRNGVVESVHFGAVVALAGDGTVAFTVGDPRLAVYPRSSNKPMQAVAMVRAGLRLAPEQLAVVCASHDGTDVHLDVVRSILTGAGLDPGSLATTPDLPLDPGAAEAVLRAGGTRTALQMNCSGKHSGMLATCVVNGWPHRDGAYLHPDHPLQRTIASTIAELADEEPSHVGVDGCGAPAHVLSLVGVARAFRSIAGGAAGPAGDEVATAMTTHPAMVGGEARDVTQLMRHVRGLVAKDGAEGVFAAALADGRAVALKVADGANRARAPVMVAALARLGVEVASLETLLEQRILGHGRPVGTVRAELP